MTDPPPTNPPTNHPQTRSLNPRLVSRLWIIHQPPHPLQVYATVQFFFAPENIVRYWRKSVDNLQQPPKTTHRSSRRSSPTTHRIASQAQPHPPLQSERWMTSAFVCWWLLVGWYTKRDQQRLPLLLPPEKRTHHLWLKGRLDNFISRRWAVRVVVVIVDLSSQLQFKYIKLGPNN